MVTTEHQSTFYQRPRETKYVVDFGNIFNPVDSGQQMAFLLANYIVAANLKPELIVQPHRVREKPTDHQREFRLATTVGQSLERQAATVYEFEDGRSPILTGVLPKPGQRTVIVDGAVRTGDTILRTAAHLRKVEKNIDIKDAVVYILRPEGKKRQILEQKLAAEGIQLHALISARELLGNLLAHGYLSSVAFQEALSDEDFSDQ